MLARLFIVASVIAVSACGANNFTPVSLDPINSGLGTTITLLEATVQQGVPEVVAKTAFAKFDEFRQSIAKDRYILMVDFTQHSSQRRLYMVDRQTGLVESMHVAHGEGSDPDKDGLPQYFSNIPNSRMSSLGSYIIAERYIGKWGPSLRLDGLESTNSHVRNRAIVLHPASYVGDNQASQGLSWGCPAVPFAWINQIIDRMRDGGFLYIYGVNQYKETSYDKLIQVMANLPGFEWTSEGEK